MLFLNICEVRAFNILDVLGTNIIVSSGNSYTSVTGHYQYNGSDYVFRTSGFSSSGSISGTTSGSHTWNFHIRVPYFFGVAGSGNVTLNENDLYAVFLDNLVITSTTGFVNNVCAYSVDGTLINGSSYGSVPIYYCKAARLLNSNTGDSNYKVGLYGYLEFDWSTINLYSSDTLVTFTPTYDEYVYTVAEAYKDQVTSPSSDVITHEQLEELNDTQESIKDTAEDTNSKITDFFGNFFTNLIGVFVPESNYFSNWFSRVNDLLADKLGILYFPFDFIIDTLTTINSNSSTSSGQIIFPEMSFTNSATSETFVLLNRQVINLNDYDVPFTSSENSALVGTTNFTSLLSIIRLFTGIAFTLALVHLFIDKLHLILRGSERG